jgi:uncharacterized membrane protein
MARRVVRWLGIAALVIGYPLLAHYTNESAHSANLGALVAIAPVLLIALVLAWRSARRFVLLAALALSCVALWLGWSAFARTLIAGQQPLCTRLAEAMQAPLTPQYESYTRQVTLAWSLFFAAMALASTLLFFLAPLAAWSVFANFLTLPLVALMFIVEYGVRRYRLPEMQHMHILDAVRAFRNTPARPR